MRWAPIYDLDFLKDMFLMGEKKKNFIQQSSCNEFGRFLKELIYQVEL